MSAPLVSVIIPTHNRAALLCQAVESVLEQSYGNLEIIVIDDGSTDDTAEAVQRYADRVRYTRRPNAGVNAARNLGLKQARGEFVALLDSDDLWPPYKIELQVRLLRTFTDVGFTFSNFHIFRGPSPHTDLRMVMDGLTTWHEQAPDRIDPYSWQRPFSSMKPATLQLPREDFNLCGGDIYSSSLFCPYVLPSTVLIRKAAIPAQLRFSEFDPACGDWEFFARLSKETGCLYVDLQTTFKRAAAENSARGDVNVQLARRIAMIDRLWRADRQFYSEHGDRVDEVQRRLLLQAAKLHLLSARGGQARALLKRARALSDDRRSFDEMTLRALAAIPGSAVLLFLLRVAVNRVRQMMAN